MERDRPKGRGRALMVLALLCGAVLFVLVLVSAFKLGMATALAAAGGGLVLYQVPAAIFDWPRLVLEDIAAFFAALWDGIMGFFDWS